jgi:DNA polymerase V
VGIAQSKTLAKMSSKFAKNYKGYNGVCMIDTEAKRRKALELFNLSDVWGIGRQTFQKLNYYGIHSALELANKKESWIRSHFNKAMVQTWMELNGIPCIDTSEVKQKQTICTSRSFGDMVTELDSLKSSVASFAASCANKLRGQDSVSGSITVFICSNNFRTDLEQYSNGSTYTFLTPTSDTIEITKAAMSLLEAIYRIGIHYKKAGVILGDICTALPIQQNLFDEIKNRSQRRKLMSVVDNINQRYGLKSLCLGVEGLEKQSWHVKSDHRSGNYLSDINEILTIKI